MSPTPQTIAHPFPAPQAEDYLALLRRICVISWIGLLLTLGLAGYVKAGWADVAWPSVGPFSQAFSLLSIEFTLANLGFSALILRRGWFERAPRAAIHKLGVLLGVVLVWLGTHFLLLLQITGLASSPLLVLVPIIVLAAYTSLPTRPALLLALGLALGFCILQLLQRLELIGSQGAFAAAFSGDHGGSAPTLLVIVGAMIAAWILGIQVRERLDHFGLALHRPMIFDPVTRLFNRATLLRRVDAELHRSRHQDSATALLMLAVDQAPSTAAHSLTAEALLLSLANSLREALRSGPDTAARYNSNTLAALLPDSGAEGALNAAQRILEHVSRCGDSPQETAQRISIGIVVSNTPDATSATQLLDQTEATLASVTPESANRIASTQI